MRTNYKNLWMLAAILACGLVMTSCDDVLDVIDNPTTTETEQASAKDPGKWWIDENNMDKSVKPGDNFFMYCNGTWWKNTSVNPLSNITTRLSLMKPTFSQIANSLTDANYDIYKSHLKWADDGSEAAIAGQNLFDGVLKQSGLMEATTSIDVMRALGKMAAMGACSCLKLEPFCYNNKVCLYVSYNKEDFIEGGDDDDDNSATRSAKRPSIRQIINENPDAMAHLVPICGRSGTRDIPNEWSFVRYILEGMGVDPTQVYIYDDYQKVAVAEDSPKAEFSNVLLRQMQTNFGVQTAVGITYLKAVALEYFKKDFGFISKKAMEVYNIEINKNDDDDDDQAQARTRGDDDDDDDDDDESDTKKSLSLKKLGKTMEEEYLPYLRSKLVADQLAPKDLKDEFLNYCKDMKGVFAQRIKDSDWLSDGSKKNVLEKLDAMVVNVCYPDVWYTEGLPDFTKSQSLLEDIYIMRKAYLNLMKTLLGKSREDAAFTVDIIDNNSSLAVQNAFYNRNLNCITMLPGYMVSPFFDHAQSLAINYECFNTLGHEITHGFDTEGSKFNKYGTVTPEGIWASPADKAEFDRRTDLLVKQFEAYDVLPDEMPGVKANGKKTITENIADLGGTEIAWQNYLNRLEADGYTGEELKLMKRRFFLAYGE